MEKWTNIYCAISSLVEGNAEKLKTERAQHRKP